MSLSDFEGTVFKELRDTLQASRAETKLLNDYYEGIHKLQQLGLAIPEELKQFTVMVAWPRIAVDAVEQRLDVSGFRMPGTSVADKALWDAWQYNNMDERQSFAHLDALALARSYVCVGSNVEDPEFPLITVESPLEMTAIRDPRTHQITSALRLYDAVLGNDRRATLYLPNVTRWLIRDGAEWVDEFDPDEHNLGAVPISSMVNRNRASRKSSAIVEGISEMADIIPIADSASRALTNAQLAQETHAVPQRVVLGMTKGDFVDGNGAPLPVWESYFGAIWANQNPDAKVQQFDASDMKNFETMLNLYSRMASGVSGLSVEHFGVNTNNPPSADGQRAGETRLIKRAERKQTSFGHSWESVQRLVMRFRDGEWSNDARRLETLWRDAGTPTQAQVTDAIVKEYQTGLTDWETAQESLGRSPETIARMKERRNSELAQAVSFGTQQAVNGQ
jgi:hypothetical protein